MTKENNTKNDIPTTKNGRPIMGPTTGKKFSKDYQPSREARVQGQAKYRALESLKKEILETMSDMATVDKLLVQADKDLDEGNSRTAVDLLKMIMPKDMDITTKGESLKADLTKEAIEKRLKEITS